MVMTRASVIHLLGFEMLDGILMEFGVVQLGLGQF